MDVNVTQLLNWSSNNHMNVNFKKTKEMIINTSHCNFLDKLSVSDVEIERVNVFKLLGVHINQSLKWDDHVSAICNKATSQSNSMLMTHNFTLHCLVLQLIPAFHN